MSADDLVLVDVSDHVATITLNRPEAGNAFTAALGGRLQRALVACDQDPDVRCIVLTGAGRHFCVGLDLSAGADTFGGGGELAEFGNVDRLEALADLSTPVIAAINGHAVGVGITLAMQCDLRIVADDAKLGFVFVRRGIVPEFYAHWTVQRIVGMAKAAELFLTGRTLTGADAGTWGLVNRSVPRDDVLDAAREMAREIATQASPAAVAATKRLLWAAATTDPETVYGLESEAIRWLSNGPDVAEGVRSFLEKREPNWTTTTQDRPGAPTDH
jgi:enoyl-CoA hydratase/carnithine racemase